MAAYDFSSCRLFVDQPLGTGERIVLDRDQANYLTNVLRLREGQGFLAFNGRDGEWQAVLAGGSRKAPEAQIVAQTRPQPPAGDLWYLFAPLKSARLDYMVQKATEMGASRLLPVMTRRTNAARVNLERMRANAIEAAEQCGILSVPEVAGEVRLDALLAAWPAGRTLVFCDEDAPITSPLAALSSLAKGSPLAVLIGPEGGFDPSERDILLRLPNVLRLTLGPRVLRADTAAVVALTLVQASCGDFDG
jgi:16S rRNA (uracil1498-N3)-methyltransferase